eukprot:76412_1
MPSEFQGSVISRFSRNTSRSLCGRDELIPKPSEIDPEHTDIDPQNSGFIATKRRQSVPQWLSHFGFRSAHGYSISEETSENDSQTATQAGETSGESESEGSIASVTKQKGNHSFSQKLAKLTQWMKRSTRKKKKIIVFADCPTEELSGKFETRKTRISVSMRRRISCPARLTECSSLMVSTTTY